VAERMAAQNGTTGIGCWLVPQIAGLSGCGHSVFSFTIPRLNLHSVA